MSSGEKIAFGLIALLIAYFTTTNHVSLAPWNQLAGAGSQLASTLVGVVPLALVLLALRRGHLWGLRIGAAWAVVWFVLQLRQWWLPYLFGPTALHSDFSWYFEHGYATTTRLLPLVDGRPVPDAQHLVLQTLSLAVVCALIAVLRDRAPESAA